MAAASNYLESALLDHVLGGATYTQPATIYLALFTSSPQDFNDGVEVTGGGYARTAIAFTGSDGARSNDAVITFTAAGADFGAVTAVALYDAVSGGNLLFHTELVTPRVVFDGQSISFAQGDITVALS